MKLKRCPCGIIWLTGRTKSRCCNLPMVPVDEAWLLKEKR